MNMNIGGFDFDYWEESRNLYHNDMEIINHYDINIKVTLSDIEVDFGFRKRYLSETVDYPIENLPEELKLKSIQDEIKQYIEKEIEEKLNDKTRSRWSNSY